MPERDSARLQARIGIHERRWAEPETTIAEMAASALTDALERAGLDATVLRRIIVTCSTGGDLLIPCAAIDVAHRVGLREHPVDTFDLANSCGGFISAMDLASRAVATGDGPVAVIAVEQFSRFIRPEEPRCYVIFGDAAIATIVGPAETDEAFAGCGFSAVTSPDRRIDVFHPARTGKPEFIDFRDLDSEFLTNQALGALTGAVGTALERAQISIDDLSWVLPHQPNGEMLGRFADRLGIARDRLVPILEDHGSIGVAAVPVSLHTLLTSGRVAAGDHILLASVGSGTVAGALVYRVGA